MKTNKHWKASAPSNIALIKYAGKKDHTNKPLNPSLSYTLDHLTSTVEIEPLPKEQQKDIWKPLKTSFPINLSSNSIQRFLDFFQHLKHFFKIPGSFLIRSGNHFPGACGVASSASSFCALTLASYQVAQEISIQKKKLSLPELSALSRLGSGSSCRSFFSPWALWEEDSACSLQIEPFPKLIHQLILSDKKQKRVSSSEAHQRVLTSPYFLDREKRAKERLSALIQALRKGNWKDCFQITWDEFEDLHQLYETASLPVVYRTDKTQKILDIIKDFWEDIGSGPLVTMDAGSPVHLLYPLNQEDISHKLANKLSSEFQIIYSPPVK